MDHNIHIGCTVNECKYHCHEHNACTLERIEVTKHEPKANTVKCTDCSSFEKAE